MLNDYHNKIAPDSDSELKRIEKALEENQRKNSNIFSFIMDKGFSADIAQADLASLDEEKTFRTSQRKEIENQNTSNAIYEAINRLIWGDFPKFLKKGVKINFNKNSALFAPYFSPK